MKHSKNIIATVLICGVVSTVAFAAAKSPLWTLDGKTVKTKADKNGTWIFIPKDFEIGTLRKESNRQLKLTEENFEKANKVDKTYEEVCKIFGGKGKLICKIVQEQSDGKETYTSYSWTEDILRGHISIYVHFTNGKITETTFNKFSVSQF